LFKQFRKSLKARIILYLFLILTVSMTASTLAAFLYFSSVIRNQVLTDEQSKFRQLVNQLDNQIEDIIAFANNIAVDSDIQQMIQRQSFASSFDKAKNRQEVSTRLVFYNTLRQYICISTVIMEDGTEYSSRGFQYVNYLKSKLESPELIDFNNQDNQLFSCIYFTKDTNLSSNVICYRVKIRNSSNPSQIVGVLYLEVYASYFMNPIKEYTENYDDMVWCTNDGVIQYQKDDKDQIHFLSINIDELNSIEKISEGYLINEKISKSKWNYSVFISNRYIFERSQFVLVFFSLFFICTLLSMLLIINPVLGRVVKPIVNLTNVMSNVREGNLTVYPYTNSQDEIFKLYQGFNEMLKDLDRYVREQKLNQEQKKELEFAILLSQINPHYLYNVLNTVVYMAAEEKNDRIVEIVNAQIKVLQENLKIGERSIFTTIRDEMKTIKSYLIIQGYRYPDKYNIDIDIDETLMDVTIPKMIIQPLVENAIYHGIAAKEGVGEISILVHKSTDGVIIQIKDNGLGMDEVVVNRLLNKDKLYEIRQDRPHIGIANIRGRLNFVYGNEARLEIESRKNEYTTITMRLPVKNV